MHFQGTQPKRELPIRIFLLSGKMLTLAFPSCKQPSPNTPSSLSSTDTLKIAFPPALSLPCPIDCSLARRLNTLFQPRQIFPGAAGDRDHDELRYFVAVLAFHFLLQLRQSFVASLDHHQNFARALHFALPSIDGLHRAQHDVYARRQPLPHSSARNSPRLGDGLTCHQNHSVPLSRNHLLLLHPFPGLSSAPTCGLEIAQNS